MNTIYKLLSELDELHKSVSQKHVFSGVNPCISSVHPVGYFASCIPPVTLLYSLQLLLIVPSE